MQDCTIDNNFAPGGASMLVVSSVMEIDNTTIKATIGSVWGIGIQDSVVGIYQQSYPPLLSLEIINVRNAEIRNP